MATERRKKHTQTQNIIRKKNQLIVSRLCCAIIHMIISFFKNKTKQQQKNAIIKIKVSTRCRKLPKYVQRYVQSPVAQLPSEMQWKLREEKNPHISKSSWNNNNRKINTTKNTNRLTLQFLHTHSICSSLTHHDSASRRKKETVNEIKEKKQPEIYIVCGKKRSVIARALIMCAREMLKMRNWRVAIDCSSLGFFSAFVFQSNEYDSRSDLRLWFFSLWPKTV